MEYSTNLLLLYEKIRQGSERNESRHLTRSYDKKPQNLVINKILKIY